VLLSIKCLIPFICKSFCRQLETVLVIWSLDAKIFSNTDRYDGFTKNAKHCFLL